MEDQVVVPQRILVIGARGMLGHEVMELAPRAEAADEPSVVGADIDEVDITSPDSVRWLADAVTPGLIINLAAYTNVDGCEANRALALAVNGTGAGHVATVARERGARLIHISTDFVFDGEKDEPYLEDDAPNPISVYGASKLDGERRIQEVGGDWTILRTAWLYGRHGKNFVDTILRLASERRELPVVTDQEGCPTYAVDLAETIWRVASLPLQGIYHAVNAGSCSRFEWAREIVRVAGLNCQIRATTSAAFPAPARRPASSVLSTEKLEAATGRAMRSWRAALKAYIDAS